MTRDKTENSKTWKENSSLHLSDQPSFYMLRFTMQFLILLIVSTYSLNSFLKFNAWLFLLHKYHHCHYFFPRLCFLSHKPQWIADKWCDIKCTRSIICTGLLLYM